MSIDWTFLIVVAVVTIAAAALVSIIMASGARLLDRAHIRSLESSGSESSRHLAFSADRAGGIVLLGLVGLLVLFGLWLVIPFFH